MAQKQTKNKNEGIKNAKPHAKRDAHEFYLLEKLYEAMRNDKERGKPSSANREFYLMEKLYEAMINDKKRNTKLKQS